MLDLSPLQTASFRHLAAAYWVNEFGNWIGEIALTLLVYDRTHSPLATAGLFLAMQLLPALLAPLLTVRVETLPARAVLTWLYAIEALAFAALAWLTHRFSMPIVCGLAALDGLLGITAAALSRGATASELLRRGLLREGNAILNMGVMASSACSPVLAGALVAWKGPEAALLVDAATFIVTAAIIVTAVSLRLDADSAMGNRTRLAHAISFVRRHPPTRRLVFAIGFVAALNAIPVPIEVVFAKRTLDAGAWGYGLLLGAWGVGMVLGGMAFAAGPRVQLLKLVTTGTLLVACGYGVIALAPTLSVACAGSLVGGIGNGAAWGAALTALQERIPGSTQSAVMSMLQGLTRVMPGLGFVAGGLIAAVASPRLAFAAAALGIAIIVAGVVLGSVLGPSEIPLQDVPSPPPDVLDAATGTQETGPPLRNVHAPTFTTG